MIDYDHGRAAKTTGIASRIRCSRAVAGMCGTSKPVRRF